MIKLLSLLFALQSSQPASFQVQSLLRIGVKQSNPKRLRQLHPQKSTLFQHFLILKQVELYGFPFFPAPLLPLDSHHFPIDPQVRVQFQFFLRYLSARVWLSPHVHLKGAYGLQVIVVELFP